MLLTRFTLSLGLCTALLTPAFGQTAGNAMVRAIHASPDAPAVDVWVDGSMAFQGLRFKDYTDYASLPAGSHTLSIVVSGTKNQVLGGPINLSAGSTYSFIATGKASNIYLMGLGDLPTAPDAGTARIRVVHGAATAPAVDVYATAPFAQLTTPALTGVPFGVASGYLTVPAGNYQARVTPTGTQTVAINSGRIALTSGAVRTVIALDPATPNGPFELWLVPDMN